MYFLVNFRLRVVREYETLREDFDFKGIWEYENGFMSYFFSSQHCSGYILRSLVPVSAKYFRVEQM